MHFEKCMEVTGFLQNTEAVTQNTLIGRTPEPLVNAPHRLCVDLSFSNFEYL